VPARDRNPAKGKPLLRQGTNGNFHSGPRVHRIFTLYVKLDLDMADADHEQFSCLANSGHKTNLKYRRLPV